MDPANNLTFISLRDGRPFLQNFHFPTQHHKHEWNSGMMAIKQQIADINHEREAPNPEGRNDASDYAPWFTTVDAFVHRWGGAFVPLDIQDAVHGVQARLNLALTQF